MTRNTLFACAVVGLLSACGSDDESEETITKSREELLDPETCKQCHAAHFDEWSGSMHAYAAEDPIFLAMNARAQEAGVGDFCVNCHAPMAVREGRLPDGDPGRIAEAEKHLRGVTCYFCHNVAAVEGEHNAQLRLANDLTMRGGIRNPVKTGGAHRSAYSKLMDRNAPESATACGACHDIVTPKGVHIERTFKEWKGTLFANFERDGAATCAACHMSTQDDTVIADAPGAPQRPERHIHTFPGVDLALTEFPNSDTQRKDIQKELDNTLLGDICVAQQGPSFAIAITLDNVGAGHSWPSGAAQDRRAWVEVIAYQGDTILYQSGAEGQSAETDPDLLQLRDGAFDENGEPAHMFWDIASTKNDCGDPSRVGCMIPGAPTALPSERGFGDEHLPWRRYPAATLATGTPDRVTMRLRLTPVGFDVLDDLIASGHLDPAIRDKMQTFSIARQGAFMVEWNAQTDDFSGQLEGVGSATCTSNTQ
jgi:hypothetical protein